MARRAAAGKRGRRAVQGYRIWPDHDPT